MKTNLSRLLTIATTLLAMAATRWKFITMELDLEAQPTHGRSLRDAVDATIAGGSSRLTEKLSVALCEGVRQEMK
jgi:hypothetical protein